MNHNFDIEMAKQYGVEEAIMLNNFAHWIKYNKANNLNYHDGDYWTYNSAAAFAEIMPYWSEKQIRRIIDSLIDKGLIKVGNYHENQMVRSRWFAFTEITKCIFLDEKPHFPNQEDVTPEMGRYTYKKPYIKPDKKHNTPTPLETVPQNDESGEVLADFGEFSEDEENKAFELIRKNVIEQWHIVAKQNNLEFTNREWDAIEGYAMAKRNAPVFVIAANLITLSDWTEQGLDIVSSLLRSFETKTLIQPFMVIKEDLQGNRLSRQQLVAKRKQTILEEKQQRSVA